MDNVFWTALLLSTLAGLSTTIGSAIAICYRKPGPKFMAFTLGFSAGVLILISFVELLQEGINTIGFFYAHFSFFAGILFVFIIDISISHNYILEEYHLKNKSLPNSKLVKTSLLVALGVAIHNFPEGMATFFGTIKDINIGIPLVVAIAIHNIPEGIAISMPIYAATGNVKKAFLWSFLSGVSEPTGALFGGLLLSSFMNDMILGYVLCVVAGFMVYIALDELLPASHSFGLEHLSIFGVIGGMIVIALSIVIL